jgi:hypothetical protein
MVNAQDQDKIIGTIGNEIPGDDRIVICVYGSAACMPVNIDANMTVQFNGHETKLTQLPFGLYLEAWIERDTQGRNVVKDIKIDVDKTVICFTNLKEGQDIILDGLLTNINGIKSFKLNRKSKQVFIEYNHKMVAYHEIENKIKNAGFELEY